MIRIFAQLSAWLRANNIDETKFRVTLEPLTRGTEMAFREALQRETDQLSFSPAKETPLGFLQIAGIPVFFKSLFK